MNWRWNTTIVEDKTTENGILYQYYTSQRKYLVHQSLTDSGKWLSFFKHSDSTSLVGPPQQTKEDAQKQCYEHSLLKVE